MGATGAGAGREGGMAEKQEEEFGAGGYVGYVFSHCDK
jgi:hypothetical protein